MNKLTFEEIVAKLNELDITPENLAKGYDYDEDKDEEIKVVEIILENLGDYTLSYSKGDREGGGDEAIKVYHFKEHDVYIKITGFYSSYHGTDWDEEFIQVSPKQKVVTIFE